MAGPITAVLDDFNRADENPLSGAGSWTNRIFSAPADLQLVSNQIKAVGGSGGGAYWNGFRAGDQEGFLTIPVLPTGANLVGVWLRLQNPGTVNVNGYLGVYFPGGLKIWRCTNGALTSIGALNFTLAAGDKLWFRAIGNALTLAVFNGGAWTDKIGVTDNTYQTGYIGAHFQDTTARGDDFGGGDLLPGPRSAVLDNFNRADENPLSDGGRWSRIISTDPDLQLVSSQIRKTTNRSSMYWNPQQFGDSDAFFTVVAPPTGGDGVGPWVRAGNVGTTTPTGYFCFYSPGNGLSIWRSGGVGGGGNLTGYIGIVLAAGDKLWLSAYGSKLRLAVFRDGAGWWTARTITDTNFASGYIGILGGNEANWRIDDFGGGDRFPVPFINSVTVVYTPAVQGKIHVPAISSVTAVYAPTLIGNVAVPFIASSTVVHAPTLVDIPSDIHVPFIASRTRVFGVFSLFGPRLYSGPGNGGEMFVIRLAPAGTSSTATLIVALGSTDTLLQLSGDGGLPTDAAFLLTVDDEVLYVSPLGGGGYRIRGRGLSNTTPAAHASGATATWSDSYDMAIAAAEDIAHNFTADITGSGSHTYPGWLMCFDASQAYLAGSRYPMHVTEVLGVFDAGAGSTGANRCDAAQPNAVCTPATTSDDCPAALSNPSRIQTDIIAGDVALVRYTNPEASPLDLGPRATALQSWFGLKRVSAVDVDVTFTDPTGHVVDGSINERWLNPLGPGIAPDTGGPTAHDVPYTTATLLGSSRTFTHGPPGYSEKGWPIGVLAVRQGNRRIPFWQSWDWHDYSFVYSGFGIDAPFAQLVVNRNGVIFGTAPIINLPGPQDIDGPDAVWDDGSYYFAVSWFVAIFAGPYLVMGPTIGSGGGSGGGGSTGVVPTVGFPGGVGGGPVVSTPPAVEGGSGGGITAAPSTGLHVNQRI